MSLYLWIGLGSALGGMLRFALSGWVTAHFGRTFPWDILIINVAGSLAIGFFATLTEPAGRFLVNPTVRQFVMIGIFGGFTTYSSFSWGTLALVRDGEWFRAGLYAVSTFVVCFVAVWLGYLGAAALNSLKGV
jgi:fluoride exporter